MKLTQDERALLWLSSAEISARKVHTLLEKYESPAAFREEYRKNKSIAKFLPVSEGTLTRLLFEEELDALIDRLERKHVHLLFSHHREYPSWLSTIDDSPYLLYYAGRLACMEEPMVAVVGTRKASSYGGEMARRISRELAAAGVTVVSGLARGIDTAAHTGALEADGATIGVLGCGINCPYPPENTPLLREIASGKGLIISEYPLDAPPQAYHFPYRNRIISGLSLATVFVEGAVKSGGMHTVNSALVQGREVFAVPGLVGSAGAEGPHAILREGARIVTSGKDILDDLGLSSATLEKPVKAKEKPLPAQPMQREIIRCLNAEPLTIEQLAEKLDADTGELLAQLTMLEINGFVKRDAGNLFLAVM